MSEKHEEALHRRIRNDIEGRIISGEWPPGTRIPFELELAAQYDCSRMTVNKAMTELVRAGLIERRKKSGSFVLQPKFHSAVLEVHDITREVQSLNVAHSHAIHLREVRKASAADRARLGLDGATNIVEIVTLHRAGRRPFCLEDRLINLAAVPEAEAEDFARVAPGTWLIEKVPWNEAEHRIHAVAANAEEARLLEIPKGTACLVVERRTFGTNGPVTQVRIVYPGDRHALTARFTPSAAGAA
jgi:histidine utilization repressor, proteobacterial